MNRRRRQPLWFGRTVGRETWTEWLYPYRALQLTREGWIFIGGTIAIGLAALNTGHNLFYLIFAMLVSMVAVSGLLSERQVREIVAERRLPSEVFARAPTPLEIRLRNRNRKRSVYGIRVQDGVDGELRRLVGFVGRLDPGAERTFHSLWTFPRRGRYRFRSIRLMTRFPFGLFEKVRIVPILDDLLVFPALGEGSGRAGLSDEGVSDMRRSRLGEEMIHLRPFRDEDDPRRIHWRVSARVGELIVQDQGQHLNRPVVVFLDTRGPAGESFEKAVGLAASLLREAVETGASAALYSYQRSFACSGRDSLRQALAFLAEVEPAGVGGDSESFDRWSREIGRGAGGVFVTAGEAPEVPAGTLAKVA